MPSICHEIQPPNDKLEVPDDKSIKLYTELCRTSILTNVTSVRAIFYVHIITDRSYLAHYRLSAPAFLHPVVSINQVLSLTRPNSVTRFIGSLMTGHHSIYDIYQAAKGVFEGERMGARALGYERFLRHLERAFDLFGILPMASLDTCPLLFPDIVHKHTSPVIKWPRSQPIKIQCCVSPLFAETALGLSQSLDMLGIPNKIVSSFVGYDPSLYIVMFLPRKANYLHHYIVWNFEKNPRVVDSWQDIGLFWESEDTNPNYAIYRPHLSNIVAVWESSPSQLSNWEQQRASLSTPPFHVPPLVPLSGLIRSCVGMSVAGIHIHLD